MIITFKIKDKDEAEQFVFAAQKVKRDVWISAVGLNCLLDAKSVLGIYSVVNKPCCLIINDDDYNTLAMNLPKTDMFCL